MSKKLIVHNPQGYPPTITGKQLAPRPESLDGKVLFLVDCLFDNSDNFMAQLQEWFSANLPRVTTKTIKPYGSWVEDPEMQARIVAEGDAAILGIGL